VPTGDNPIAVNKYIISYNLYHPIVPIHEQQMTKNTNSMWQHICNVTTEGLSQWTCAGKIPMPDVFRQMTCRVKIRAMS